MGMWSVVDVDGGASNDVAGRGDGDGFSRQNEQQSILSSPLRSHVLRPDERHHLHLSQHPVEQSSHAARSHFIVPQTQAFAANLPLRRANVDDETVRRCCWSCRRSR